MTGEHPRWSGKVTVQSFTGFSSALSGSGEPWSGLLSGRQAHFHS